MSGKPLKRSGSITLTTGHGILIVNQEFILLYKIDQSIDVEQKEKSR